jgi:regulator of replication initiation timing
MSLPRAVQQQVEEADALVAQLNGAQPVNPDTGEPIVTEPQPAPEPQPQPISQEPDPKPAVPDETWEQRYHSLKGKFDAEVPRLYAQVREMNDQIKQLVADNAVLKAQPAAPATPAPAKTLITEQDKEAFGTDLIDLIDRATEQKLAGSRELEAQLRAEINELKGKLGNVSERQVVSDKDRYETALTAAVPDWQALNVDQGFLNWLAEVDPVYGMPRQYALTNAYEALDATRTANIFNQYKKSIAPATQNRANLQSQVAPTRSRTSPAPTNPNVDKRVYTQQDIDAFYSEWRRGLIDEAQAVQIENDIHAATTEGRIRY